jgi:membrane-associated protease RseP (regulator of RpoE activity)
MKVTEYFLGFGPRLWSVRRGETDYGVKAIPAGGYVRIVGMTSAEEVDPVDEPRSYRQATFPRRLLVAVAGSAMHFLMAFVLLWAIFAVTGYGVASSRQIDQLATLNGVASPARQAGLRPGDVITAVDGHAVSSGSALVSAIERDAGRHITLTVERHGRTLTLHAVPLDGRHVRLAHQSSPVKSGNRPVGFLGVDLGTVNETVGPLSALGHAATGLGSATKATALGIAQVFSVHGLSSFFHQVATAGQHQKATATSAGASGATAASGSSGQQVTSVVGAVELVTQAAHVDLSLALQYLVAINLFVGMVNLFPMLPLDGGHVAIAVYERLRSRRGRPYHADVAKMMPVAYLFLAFIVVVGLSALYANIVAPPSLGG